MKTKVMTKMVALGLCLSVSLSVKAVDEPGFTELKPFADAGYPRGNGGNVWGDYNNDGRLDVLIYGYGTFKLYQGNEDTTFTDVTSAVFGTPPSMLWQGAVAWLDYDKDGSLDLIIAGHDGSAVVATVYKNAGAAGNYALAADAAITLPALKSHNEDTPGRLITVADYDGDGYPDILLAGDSDGTPIFSLYKNNGASGGFALQAAPYNGGGFTVYQRMAVAWGDFNGDGKPDILYNGRSSSDDTGYSGVYKNNGDGTFDHVAIPTTGLFDGEVAWIDYDNDGDLDALVTGYAWYDGGWQWWHANLSRNNGDGTFTEVSGHGIGATSKSAVAVGDINKDGFADVVEIGDANGGVYYNNGDGTFTKTLTVILSQVTRGMVSLVDIDGDNDLDFVITGNYVEPLLYKNTSASAPPIVIPPLPVPAAVDTVAFTQVATPVGGTAAFPVNLTRGSGAAWGDYDNDGNLDVLVWGVYADDGTARSWFYRNNGNGTFTDVTTTVFGSSLPGLYSAAAAWLDYDNDGVLDLILAGATVVTDDAADKKSVTKVFKGAYVFGAYSLSEVVTLSDDFSPFDFEKSGGISRNIAVADYNKDGYQDVLIAARYTDPDAGETERHFRIYKNKGGESFELQDNAAIGLIDGNGGGIAWGDYNKDGYLDILFSGYRDSEGWLSAVFTGHSDGVFTETKLQLNGADFGHPDDGQKVFGTEGGEVTWVDVNADGYLDALITGSGPSYKYNADLNSYTEYSGFEWWNAIVFPYNPTTQAIGTGQPGMMGNGLGETCNSSVTWVDLNDDGLPDIITSGQSDFAEKSNRKGSAVNYGTSNGVYYRQPLLGSGNLGDGTVSVVDYDKDGKMDVFATGESGVVLLKNTGNVTPAAPATPTGLSATSDADGQINLSWTASAAPTLRYNIFAKRQGFITSLLPVNEATGALKVSLDHAPLLHTSAYSLSGLAGGEYTVGVQAVGVNGKTSAFATATLTIGGGGGGGNTGVEKALPGSFAAYKSGEAIVVATDIAREAELTVYSVAGAKVWSKTGALAGNTLISGLQQGAVYFVVLRVGSASEVRKVAL